MWHRQIAGTGLIVSPLCLGTVHYGTAMEEAACFAQLDQFFQAGGNFVDTAHVYGDWVPGPRGRSESVIGRWMKHSGMRAVVSTKGAHPRLEAMDKPRVTEKDILQDVQESLENLGTDAVDLYFLHRDDESVPVGEIIDWMEALTVSGLIRYYGCSNWTLGRIRQAADWAVKKGAKGFVSNQLMWSLADVRRFQLGDPTMLGMDAETYAYHAQSGLFAMAYMAAAKGYFPRLLAGEALPPEIKALYDGENNRRIAAELRRLQEESGLDAAALSLAYLMNHPFDSVPIASFEDEAQLSAAMAACQEKPDSAVVEALHRMKQFVMLEGI